MSTKLQQVQRNYRLRNHFGMPVTSLILKSLNAINVNSEYCVKRINFLFCLRFIHYKDILFKNLHLRSSDVKKLNSDVKIQYPMF